MVLVDHEQANVEITGLSEAVFHVSWYDVGEEVLDGLEGVELVNSGYDDDNFMERHIVLYDPAKISIDEMEKALKDVGTYLETKKE